MAPAGPIFVIGSGPMIGSHTARLFATKSFTRVVLLSRSADNLARDAAFVTAAAPDAQVGTYTADVTDHAALISALKKAVADHGRPEVVIYNPARINYVQFGEYSTEDMVIDWKIPNLGLYTTAVALLPGLQALAKEQPESHPALYVTSSQLIYTPVAPVFSLSMAKAAQHSLVKLLAQQNKGVVHVAVVAPSGPVSFEEPVNNPPAVSEKFWELYSQAKGEWEEEIRIGW